MNNQTRNHLNLQKHIADQDHIIRVRNAEIAALRKRAEKAERERDEWKDSAIKAMADLERAEHPRPLTPDAITDEMMRRARRAWDTDETDDAYEALAVAITAALTEPPARPEGAEDIERVILDYKRENAHRGYSEAEIADRIAEEMNR